MKRAVYGLLSSVLLAVLFALPSFAVGVNSFVVTQYDVAMKLSRDNEKRSRLEVVETITADFTRPKTNRGITRNFVKNYDGHPTDFTLKSVTDEQSKKLDYNWKNNTLRIGNADKYVEGVHTYVITYTQRDVTKFYEDTGKTEFYWDMIGVEWRVPIERYSVSLTLDDSLASQVKTDMQCYVGKSGSAAKCSVERDNVRFTTTGENIGNSAGVTFAIGFGKDTFAPYKQSFFDMVREKIARAWTFMNTVITPILAVIGGIVMWRKHSLARPKEVKNILNRSTTVEYTPPKDHSVLESAVVYGQRLAGREMTAQIIDLAVRHVVKIHQIERKVSVFGGKVKYYNITLERPSARLDDTETGLIQQLFGDNPAQGAAITTEEIKKKSAKILSGLRKTTSSIKGNEELFALPSSNARDWYGTLAKMSFLGFVVMLGAVPLLIVGIVAIALRYVKYRTVKGAELKKYLEGLKMYIGVAEKDRIKMLQSPEGAEKVGLVDTDDAGALVKLYERVLPYAILFGQEKEWAKELGQLYEQAGTNPDWSVGNAAFSGAMFGSMMNDFTSATTQASDYSSSSGGSGGGGSAGGGGGGGGGGGW